mgnify:CR=1 FL=1
MTENPLDAAGFDLTDRHVGKHVVRPDDGVPVADWRSRTFPTQSDLTDFVKWVRANSNLDDPVKKLVSALVTDYNRQSERSR